MGPWFVRDEANPFRPGCRLETIERWVRIGRVGPETVIRGPSTNQHWSRASRAPGVSRLLGLCHACRASVEPAEVICGACGASLESVRDRQHLGLTPVRALPGRTDPGLIASSLLPAHPARVAAVPGSARLAAFEKADPATGADPTARSPRLERRVKRAERRAVLMSIAAASFALLFAGSLVLNRVGSGDQAAGDNAPVSPAFQRSGPLSAATASGTHAPTQTSATAAAVTPDAGRDDDDETRLRLLESIDALVSSGRADDLAEARRLLDGPLAGVLTPDDIERWLRRVELAEQARDRSRLP
ncbi:MAG: hypothetical protein K8E66_10985 [Phycisphaerales bacterium]|nr:hypothetical protein [Phycisphaerales bacterium]